VLERNCHQDNMEVVNRYFSDLVFTWLEKKEIPTESGRNQYIVYGAGLSSQMGGNQRYVLAFVPIHLAIKRQSRIEDLPWKCIQTRILAYSYKLKTQRWSPPSRIENPIFEIQKRTDGYSEYRSTDENVELELVLLHNSKRKTKVQYNNKITLLGAIEIFRTVITHNGNFYNNSSDMNNLYQPVGQSDENNSSVITPVG